ncbi:MAG: hypothetical protein WC680_04330 [Sulfuricurvum sp.]|jgi:uncharacterized membrane protein
MKILLLNDNPVVRKLVALSAQKTKDDLSVVWSVDEIEGDVYDLLIVDDAHYSNEAMTALKEKIQYKTSLLMATRGNATPAGFDNVINKPFLPTDLVDLFAKIDKDLLLLAKDVRSEEAVDTSKVILTDTSVDEVPEAIGYDITNLDDDLDFDLEDIEVAAKTNVLDHEEVQELQDLLDDTDNFDSDDELPLDEEDEESEISDDVSANDEQSDEDFLKSLDDDIQQALESDSETGSVESELDDALDEFDFDEELLGHEDEEPIKTIDESIDDEDFVDSLDDLLTMDEEEAKEPSAEEAMRDDTLDDIDAFMLDDLAKMDEDEELSSLESEGDALSDDEFGELEQQIQEAVEELGIEDLEQEFDEVEMENFGEFEGLADLDSLSERDIKLAIGEEVEEEPEVRVGHSNHSSLDAEALSEALDEVAVDELGDEFEEMNIDVESVGDLVEEHHGTPAEGMDALQALLKALANEDVAKTLKGLSINININFGNEK